MNIFAILTHTPIWVWGVLLLVVLIGLRRTSDRVVTAPRLLLGALLITGLAVSNLAVSANNTFGMIGAAIGLAAGLFAGTAIETRTDARAERVSHGMLRVKGEWVSLIVMLSIFAVRYFSSIAAKASPDFAAGEPFHFAAALLVAFFGALTVARTFLRLRVAYAPA